MNIYETILIFSATLAENKRKEALHEIVKLINDGGATELKEQDWGRRELAFTMNKVKTGHYYQLVYKLTDVDNTKLMSELTANLRIMDGLVKFQTHKINTKNRKPKRNTTKAFDL